MIPGGNWRPCIRPFPHLDFKSLSQSVRPSVLLSVLLSFRRAVEIFAGNYLNCITTRAHPHATDTVVLTALVLCKSAFSSLSLITSYHSLIGCLCFWRNFKATKSWEELIAAMFSKYVLKAVLYLIIVSLSLSLWWILSLLKDCLFHLFLPPSIPLSSFLKARTLDSISHSVGQSVGLSFRHTVEIFAKKVCKPHHCPYLTWLMLLCNTALF